MQSPPPYGFEPSLAEALDDPIIQQLMMSDGVSRAEVLHLMDYARQAARAQTVDWRPGLLPQGILPH